MGKRYYRFSTTLTNFEHSSGLSCYESVNSLLDHPFSASSASSVAFIAASIEKAADDLSYFIFDH